MVSDDMGWKEGAERSYRSIRHKPRIKKRFVGELPVNGLVLYPKLCA